MGNRAKESGEHVVNVITCETCKPPVVNIASKKNVHNPSDAISIDGSIDSQLAATFTWSIVMGKWSFMAKYKNLFAKSPKLISFHQPVKVNRGSFILGSIYVIG